MNWWVILAGVFVWGLIYTARDSVVDRLLDAWADYDRRKK